MTGKIQEVKVQVTRKIQEYKKQAIRKIQGIKKFIGAGSMGEKKKNLPGEKPESRISKNILECHLYIPGTGKQI